MATIYGSSGADNLTELATEDADTIYGYDPSSPTATQVGTGMFQTVFATAPAGDANRLFIAEKGGAIKVLDLQSPTDAPKTILTISPLSNGDETGVLGLTLHPEFAVEGSPHRGKLYVNYSASVASGHDQVVVEYIVNPNDPAAGPIAGPKTIMTIDYVGPVHRAGWMEFGPDNMLYIATGENDVASNSQTILNQDGSVNLKGKILRIDVNGDSFEGDPNNNYRIPADNPTSFQNIDGTFSASAIWAVGLRNPWRCSFGPDGTLYIADVGNQAYEEINIGTAGANYGWRPTTNGAEADGPQGNGYTDPVYAYEHDVLGRSITGGYIYEGPGEFNGHYIFGDYGNGKIFAIDLRVASPQPLDITNRIAFPNNTPVGAWNLVSFGQDGQGNLYVLGKNGRILKLNLNGSTTDEGDILDGKGGNDVIHGGGGNDTIHGGDDNDTLYGDADDDHLYGDDGADRLEGGTGNDTYYVDSHDTVVEAENGGIDTVVATESHTLSANVENLILAGTDAIDGTGNELANEIIGNGAANVLDGGAGADKLSGGAGNDTYIVDGSDTVVEAEDEGIDTVRSHLSYTLGANVENLVLLGTAAVNGTGNELDNEIAGNDAANSLNGGIGADTLRGADGNDILDGGAGGDRLYGGAGDDTYILNDSDTIEEDADQGIDTVRSTRNSYTLGDNVENLTLLGAAVTGRGNDLGNEIIGNDEENFLFGEGGADTLDGGEGIDNLVGGAGDDIYIVNGDGDVLTEEVGGGTDTVRSSVTYSLASWGFIENLTLTGTAAINGTGNNLANEIIGNSAANVLEGGQGLDTLNGGGGNDTYILHAVEDVTDEVVEEGNSGIDTVESWIEAYQLTANVENLILKDAALTGIGNDLANEIIGNDGNNILDGGAGGIDTLTGGAGNDTYFVGTGDRVVETVGGGTDEVRARSSFTLQAGSAVESIWAADIASTAALNLTGNAFSQVIAGNAGANVLNGGGGLDTLGGLGGNDTYYVDDAKDIVREMRSQGTDTVIASASYKLAAATTSGTGHVEILKATSGTKSINLTGNELSNTLVGNSGANRLYGCSGNDKADAGSGNDRLYGDAGNDLLTGGAGNDLLSGGDGHDRLVGGTGKDTFTGGTGRDVFVFDDRETSSSRTSADYIADFSGRGGDKIDLRLVDANTRKSGDQSFSFIGTKAFTKEGQVRYEKVGSYTYVSLNTDADKSAEAVIKLKGAMDLSKTWFVL